MILKGDIDYEPKYDTNHDGEIDPYEQSIMNDYMYGPRDDDYSSNATDLANALSIICLILLIVAFFISVVIPFLFTIWPLVIVACVIWLIVISVIAKKNSDKKKADLQKEHKETVQVETKEVDNPGANPGPNNRDLMDRVDRRYLDTEEQQVRDVKSLNYMKRVLGENAEGDEPHKDNKNKDNLWIILGVVSVFGLIVVLSLLFILETYVFGALRTLYVSTQSVTVSPQTVSSVQQEVQEEVVLSPLEQAMIDNNMRKGTYPEKYVGVYEYEYGPSTLSIDKDGMMTIQMDGLDEEVKERFFCATGKDEIKRQLFYKGNYELSSAFFRDPENGDYSVINVYIGHVNNVPYFSFSIDGSTSRYHQIEDINGNEMDYRNNHSKNYSSSSNYGSSSSGKKQYYNYYDYDPDDYDSPEDYADDAWGDDFDDWDDAYDYWENW